MVGFLIMFLIVLFLDINIELDVTPVADLKIADINKHKAIVGEVLNVNNLEKVTIFDIKDESGYLKVIFFDSKILPEENKIYRVEGKVSVYKNELELIGESINIIP